MGKEMEIVVILPAYNEEKNLSKVLIKVKKYCSEIIVVDDGSSDSTFAIAKKHDVIVLKLPINLGKGAALRTGCDFAISKGARKIVVMDSDGQHEPSLIPSFVGLLKDYDIIFGKREKSEAMPWIFRLGNLGLGKLAQILFRIKISDTQCGYRAFTSEAYKKIRWQSQGYTMESEMIANAGKSHLKYSEIPTKTIYLDRYKGTTILDGLKIGFSMILWRLQKR